MKKKRSDGDRTRTRILEAATALFARQGREGVGLREIAKQSGVALPTISYHFGSKAELYSLAASEAILSGIDYEEMFEPCRGIDVQDPQQVADALHAVIRGLAMHLSQTRGADYTDLICQALFRHDHLLQRALLEVFDHFEVPFLEFLDRVGVTYEHADKGFWLVFIWSQLLFYVSAREFLYEARGLKEIPVEFYEDLAWRIAHFLCLEFGLPDPGRGPGRGPAR